MQSDNLSPFIEALFHSDHNLWELAKPISAASKDAYEKAISHALKTNTLSDVQKKRVSVMHLYLTSQVFNESAFQQAVATLAQ